MFRQKQVSDLESIFCANQMTIKQFFLFQGFHEVFIRTENSLLEFCPIRIDSFTAEPTSFEPVLRVQLKELLEHTFDGVLDRNDHLQIEITGKKSAITIFIIFLTRIINVYMFSVL